MSSCAQARADQGQFKTEWFARQGAADGDMSNRPEGYFLTAEAATTADAVCMWAKIRPVAKPGCLEIGFRHISSNTYIS